MYVTQYRNPVDQQTNISEQYRKQKIEEKEIRDAIRKELQFGDATAS